MPRPKVSEIQDCAQLREACSQIEQVPEGERNSVKHELMRKSVELDCPESIPDDWRVRIGKDYE
jgi:hypothetical protein